MSCIESDHLSTIAGGDFNIIFQLAYEKLIRSSTKSQLVEIEEGFQYSSVPQWCVVAKISEIEYALVISSNLASNGQSQHIAQQVKFPLSRTDALQEFVNELEIQEEIASDKEIHKLLVNDDLDETMKIAKRMDHRKAFRKDIVNGADPFTAKIQAGLTNPYPHKSIKPEI